MTKTQKSNLATRYATRVHLTATCLTLAGLREYASYLAEAQPSQFHWAEDLTEEQEVKVLRKAIKIHKSLEKGK